MTPDRSEMWLPVALFLIFALLSVVGAYLVIAHWRGRRMGILAALVTALFFGALLVGLGALLRGGGFF
jgi:hypothetical protein